MAQNEPQRKETPPGPSPNSPSLLCQYQCRSGKLIRLANRIEKIGSVARIESNRMETFLPELECSNLWTTDDTIARTINGFKTKLEKECAKKMRVC